MPGPSPDLVVPTTGCRIKWMYVMTATPPHVIPHCGNTQADRERQRDMTERVVQAYGPATEDQPLDDLPPPASLNLEVAQDRGPEDNHHQ